MLPSTAAQAQALTGGFPMPMGEPGNLHVEQPTAAGSQPGVDWRTAAETERTWGPRQAAPLLGRSQVWAFLPHLCEAGNDSSCPFSLSTVVRMTCLGQAQPQDSGAPAPPETSSTQHSLGSRCSQLCHGACQKTQTGSNAVDRSGKNLSMM